ncbi:MAG: hypothetical protein D6714_18580 [Bacteroidetes bacterium]|nr:MAG: hypothetical protein D6714_18580 [Bacteroidota bacterium]
MKFFATILFWCVVWSAGAQRGNQIHASDAVFDRTGIVFMEPVEGRYKRLRVVPNEFQNYQLALFSPRENMEIRVAVLPYDSTNIFARNPHVATARAFASVATNDEERLISGIVMPPEKAARDFNADWGMTYFFEPKEGFARYRHCRMIALYKKERATVFIFYLFDDPENEALDKRYAMLRFLEASDY